jgi:hypothetical protein
MERLLQFIAATGIRLDGVPRTTADPGRIQTILAVVFSITGAIALLIITLAGLRYILSRGDPSATAQAKNAILYAVIGLVISLSAVTIVTFVIGRV